MKTSLRSSYPNTHRPPLSWWRQQGITLMELLMVLAILGVLVGVGIPSMRSMVRSFELTSASNDLLGGLLLARTEALKRNSRGVICKSSDGEYCALAGGWEQGWMVFHDANNNGMRDLGEVLIERQQALASELRINGNATVARYVSYTADGTTKLSGGGFQAGTITLCRVSATKVEARQIVVSAGGRPRVQRLQVESCA